MTLTTPIPTRPRTLLLLWSLSILLICPPSLVAAEPSVYQDIDPEYSSYCDPPHPYGSKIEDSSSAFYYLSDIEHCSTSGRHPLLVTRIRNVNSDDLIVTWKSGDIILISRPSWNKLPAGKVEDGSHPVCDYNESPTTNTIISYTQQKRQQRAAAYLETVSCQSVDDALLQSHIRTAYKDKDGIIQDIEVDFQSSIVDGPLIYEIGKSNSMVDAALGGVSNAIKSLQDQEQVKIIQELLARQAASFGVETSFTTLYDMNSNSSVFDEIPEVLGLEDLAIFDTPVTADKHYMKWQMPTEQFATVMQTVTPLVLLDADGQVVTTRPVGLYIPTLEE